MNNNEIKVTENNVVVENLKEERRFNYQLIDLSNLSTISNYGSEATDAIGQILDKSSNLAIEKEQHPLSDEDLKEIYSFEKSLDDGEKELNKKPGLIENIIRSTKLGRKKYEESMEENTNQGRYKRYCDMLDRVKASVEEQKTAIMSDINERNKFIEQMSPYVEMIEDMIVTAKSDYGKRLVDNENEKVNAASEEEMESAKRTEIILNFYQGKIDELESNLIAYKSVIAYYRQQQANDYQNAEDCINWINNTVKLLKTQGSVMVYNRRIERRQESLLKLKEVSNEAARQNAEDIESNARRTVEQKIAGNGFSTETLQIMLDSIIKGQQILSQGEELVREKRIKDREIREDLNKTLEENANNTAKLLETNGFIEDLNGKKSSYRRLNLNL